MPTIFDNLFNRRILSKLTQEKKICIVKSTKEIESIIKTPGQNGEFCQISKKEIVPILHKLFQSVLIYL